MHRFVLGNPVAALLPPILLCVVAHRLLNKRRASAEKEKEDPNPGAPSPSIPPTRDYEVFLSFRGVDTRLGFVDYLYQCLLDAGIRVLIDDDELGERIGTDPAEPIKKSKILIPIISVNYASSKWCLDTLVCMMECKKRGEHIVMPIFYRVQCAQVRCQDGSFGRAFHYYGRRRPNPEVDKWKKALADAGSSKGFELERDANGREGKLVSLIVKAVLDELKKVTELVVIDKPIGIDSPMAEVMELVNMSSNAAFCVGIYGIGGIGKTTLSKVIYNKLSHLFDYHSFIADIRESCNRYGIDYLQSQLIYDILGKKFQNDEHKVNNFILSKFQYKKVLILLDDVDTTNQLKALVGDPVWFAPGSRIIVTTRNKSILDGAGVNRQYESKEMDDKQSMILFSRHAFRTNSPPGDFFDLSRLVVSTSGGLPLALVVMGSFLCGKDLATWVDTIEKLQRLPHQKVQEKLKISFDALDVCQKEIFLDIACFLIGNDARVASYMWDACHLFPQEGIGVLRFMSLIRIGDNNEFIMNDQLKKLGREIVRGEDYYKPHNRSRLWDYEEAWEVLEENEGTEKIEAICLEECSSTRIADKDDSDYIVNQGSLTLTCKQFDKLRNLRFLHMSDLNLTGDFSHLFRQLRWLKWGNCPPNFVASNFHARELVILDLSRSPISDDWSGWPSMMNSDKLKVLNLTSCHSLKRTSYLSTFKRLEILILRDCSELEQIDNCIGDMENLVSLDLSGCSRLKEVPFQMAKLEQLKELLLDETAIREIPSFISSLEKLETLGARDCKSLIGLPDSIGNLGNLSTLVLSGCSELATLPNSIGFLENLQCLSLASCHQLREIPSSIGKLKLLTQLDLSGCSALVELPPQVGELKQLKKLLIDETRIQEIPSFISSLEKLETRSANNRKLTR